MPIASVKTDQLVLEQVDKKRPRFRVEDPLEAVDIVVRGELALLASKRGVAGKVDAWPHLMV